jgi:hypothetical protein
VILDTPGGLRGADLARVVMQADAILMPVCNSVFDRESAAECHAELLALPRVASGRCRVAAVGMRLDARTRGAEVLRDWAATRNLAFVGVLRDTQTYVRCVEAGLTVFDLPATQVQADLLQWEPVLRWLEPVLRPASSSVRAQPQPKAVATAASPATVRSCLEPGAQRRMSGAERGDRPTATPVLSTVARQPALACKEEPPVLTRVLTSASPDRVRGITAGPAGVAPLSHTPEGSRWRDWLTLRPVVRRLQWG